MTREEAKSCIGTIEMLQRLAYNIHGVMDVVDADNCKNIIKALEKEPCEDWYDVPSDEMTLEQARQAVKDLRKKLAEDLEKNRENLINQKATTCRHGGHCEWVACDKCNHYEPDGLNQQPCEDAVSRQAVLDGLASIAKVKARSDAQKSLMGRIMFFVEQLPSVTPKEKTGHWIDDEFGIKCSCCGIHTHLDKFERPMKFKYCSMCGAKMVEPQESEDKEVENESTRS